ncbi:Asp-tRNA(Asn)/Glu-tRNA(Gln) amidotransferase subunit GatC [bacterium]|nr:Asp-tRNA(Asn)/Glu-tRNA(Gln) amidotransferase subunit GatC [bacterium]
MAFSEKDVDYTAALARIHISAEDKKNFAVQIEHILAYVNKLNELDTQQVEPTAHILPLKNVFRPDTAMKNPASDAAVQQAPYFNDTFYRVPPVIE